MAQRVRAGESLLGTFVNLGSPLAAEICALAGFDFVVVDHEHGAGTETDLIPTVQALGGRCGALVRVEGNVRPRFQRALDAGADGVMVPRLESAEEAALAVAHTRYPPRGLRGVAYMNRGAGFGAGAPDHDVLLAIQIETRGAVDEAREIAELDGVDVLFVGPVDLAAALGTSDLPLDEIVAAARGAGKAPGLFTRTRADAERALERGFRFVTVGADSFFLAEGARAAAAR